MTKAMCAVQNGMSKKSAAKKFNVPRATLIQKLKNRGEDPILQKVGRNTLLQTCEEAYLSQQINKLIDDGAVKTDDQILNVVEKFANQLDRPNPFVKGRPSMKWLVSFKSRHPCLKEVNDTEKSGIDVSFINSDVITTEESLHHEHNDSGFISHLDESVNSNENYNDAQLIPTLHKEANNEGIEVLIPTSSAS